MGDNQDVRPDGRHATERRVLQAAVAVACLVPIVAGAAGMVFGPAMLGSALGTVAASPDSHFRYLSGLLLAIGLGFAATVPRIERSGRVFRGLTLIVVIGGIGRLSSLFMVGMPGKSMLAALAMELLVTPALAAWQYRVARWHHDRDGRRLDDGLHQPMPMTPPAPKAPPPEIILRPSPPISELPPQRRRVLH